MPTRKSSRSPRRRGRPVDAALLRPVSQDAHLLDVFTLGLQAEAHEQLFGETLEGLDQTVRVWAERQSPGEDPELLETHVRLVQEITYEDELIADMSVRIGLLYHLPAGTGAFTDQQLDLFAEINGVFNAWPYLRETLDSTTTRLGVRVRSLPTWKAPAVLPPAGEPIVLRQRFDGR